MTPPTPGTPKPGGDPSDLTDVPRDEVESTRGEDVVLVASTDDGEVRIREHILLARQ